MGWKTLCFPAGQSSRAAAAPGRRWDPSGIGVGSLPASAVNLPEFLDKHSPAAPSPLSADRSQHS